LICVSLPVHTRPAVIAGQLANFAAFLPSARVVLHVSANARFTPGELEAALAAGGCANAVINPQRLATNWGNILLAHLANVAWIRRQLPACTRICLHSSNDMLVRRGLHGHLAHAQAGNFLHHRPIRPGSRWRFTGAALGDAALLALRKRLGDAPAVGSQVEGSSYDAALLYDIADIVKHAARQPAPVPYPREEVWLSTVAHARAAPIAGTPYVFSEVHRFDRAFWRMLRVVDPLVGRRGDPHWLPRRALEFLMIRSGFHRIDRTWVERIAHDHAEALAPYEWLSDGQGTWRVFDRHGLYGVKRVPRRPDAPLRRYIDKLSDKLSDEPSDKPSDNPSDRPGAPPDNRSGTQSATRPDTREQAQPGAHPGCPLRNQPDPGPASADHRAHEDR
jgi:hypothetical protein